MVLVDTNVLIDVAVDDPAWADWSAGQLARLRESNRLELNAVIYAELSVHFDNAEHLEALLAPFRFDRLTFRGRRPSSPERRLNVTARGAGKRRHRCPISS